MKSISPALGETRCPVCTHKLDDATCIDKEDAVPAKGDITICLYCDAVFTFKVKEEKLIPVLMKEQAVNSLPHSILQKVRLAQRAARAVRPPYSSRQ
jgi:uncharacterized protein YbaR (Trm112 family)